MDTNHTHHNLKKNLFRISKATTNHIRIAATDLIRKFANLSNEISNTTPYEPFRDPSDLS
jgi:hypothetical protein